MQNRRTGLIAKKVGMTQVFQENGEVVAVTLLQASGNVVVETKTKDKNGYDAVVLAYDEVKPNKMSKPLKSKFAKAKVSPRRKLKEFRISNSAMLKVGDELDINHFVEGQSVDIQGISIGKGFAGVMKRHNFAGLEASHGVSISHRSHGSTGQRQDPGKVFKGKKMAGHLGNETVTVQNITVMDIDSALGLIAVAGSVPGKVGSYVSVSDAVKMAMPINVKFPAALVGGKAQESAPAKAEESTPAESVEAKESQEDKNANQ
jgi:large subunit ribosomal protein L3